MIKINKIEVKEDKAIFYPSEAVSQENLKCERMIICTCIRKVPCGCTCHLNANGTLIDILTNAGNKSKIEQFEARKCYKVVFGDLPPHFLVLSCLKKTCCKETYAQPVKIENEKLSKS